MIFGGAYSKALAVLALASVSAHAAEFITPLEPVSPDGFEVVCDGEPSVTNAQVLRRGPKVFFVTPARDAREVKVTVPNQPPRVLAVGPLATSVALKLNPARPVKNRDRSAELAISVAGDSAPPVVRCNVGRIEGLERTGVGTFRARYVLPETRYPEVAIIVAFAAWPHAQSIHGSMGVIRVPLASAVDVPGKVEPLAQLELTIAGSTFGPVRAGADGAFSLPVVVPPGFGLAQGRTKDQAGNARTTRIDLQLPPTDQLACVATPSHVPADGAAHARVLCATSDRFGAVATGARVQLTASTGKLSPPRDRGNGLQEWTWTAPTERGAGSSTLEAKWVVNGFESKDTLHIELGQGPVASVKLLEQDESLVHRGSVWRARVQGYDSLGRVVKQAVYSVEVAHSRVLATPLADDSVEVRWRGAGELGPVEVSLRSWGPLSFEPAKLLVWAEAGHFFAAVADLSGLPVAAQKLLINQQNFVTGDDGIVDLGALGDGTFELHHADWADLKTRLVVAEGALRYPLTDRPPRVEWKGSLQVAPEAPVNVRVRPADAGFEWWLEQPDGSLADDRQVLLTIDGASSLTTSKGHQRVSAREFSVVDVTSKIGAIGSAAK